MIAGVCVRAAKELSTAAAAAAQPLSRIRLPPWVCDGEAIARPRMKDDRFREPGLRPLRHPYPRDAILVAATPQRAPPEVDDMVLEHGQCTGVGRHCVIAEVATNDVPQPFPLSGGAGACAATA